MTFDTNLLNTILLVTASAAVIAILALDYHQRKILRLLCATDQNLLDIVKDLHHRVSALEPDPETEILRDTISTQITWESFQQAMKPVMAKMAAEKGGENE